jgi:O-antigen/teichoic acid export membrane protein
MASVGALAAAVLTLPVFLAFVTGGRWLISLMYGDAYSDAYLPLVILSAGQVANALFGSVGLLLTMTGHERDVARWLTVSAACNILLATALIPFFGMVGAAGATVVSLLIWNLAFWRTAIRKVGVDGSILPLLAWLR